jgi:hypothetical protein
MKITKNTVSAFVLPVLAVTLVGNLVSCGTIMYPERNGQKPGQIDPLVAVLDGVGLLFFIIPGVIAFAVDFNNHSIYLPHGHTSSNSSAHPYLRSQLDGKPDKAAIEKYVLAETGVAINLEQPGIVITRLDSVAQLDARFSMQDSYTRVALAR